MLTTAWRFSEVVLLVDLVRVAFTIGATACGTARAMRRVASRRRCEAASASWASDGIYTQFHAYSRVPSRPALRALCARSRDPRWRCVIVAWAAGALIWEV